MTEEEAQTKRCCGPVDCGWMVKVTFTSDGHDHVHTHALRTCIGSVCMGWRFSPRQSLVADNPLLTVEPARPRYVPASWEWLPSDGDELASWVEPVSGYCGLAGKP